MSKPHVPRKRFGQNFLIDTSVIEQIVDSINPQEDEAVVEIGPGKGALTFPLLQRCKRLTVIELDRDLVATLETAARRAAENGQLLQVISQDALTFDFTAFGNEKGRKIRIVGNLPYNISTPILFHLLSAGDAIEDMHFMLQREVVERMCAPPGSKAYGKLSVMLQWQCHVKGLFAVPSTAFKPAPRVESATVCIVPKTLSVTDQALSPTLEKVVTAAFTMRRKTLRNSLAKWIDAPTMTRLDIDPTARAETLQIDDFCRIAKHVAQTSD